MDTHYVYVLAERENQKFGPVKIGIAVDPEKRLGELQTGNPRQLWSLGTFGPMPERHAKRLEQYWQWMFQFDRIRGEWFDKRILDRINDGVVERSPRSHENVGAYEMGTWAWYEGHEYPTIREDFGDFQRRVESIIEHAKSK